MTKLTLTKERERIIAGSRPDWLQAGLCTDPADFDAAEAALTGLYAGIGRKKPYFVRLSSPFGAELYINLLEQTFSKPVGATLGGQLWDQLGDQLRDQLRDQLWGQLWDQLRGQLRDQLGGQLWDQLRGQLWDQLRDQLGEQLWDQLRGQLGEQLWDQLRDQLGGQLWDQLGDQLREQKLKFFWTWNYGQWDAWIWGFYDGGRRVGAKYNAKSEEALNAHCVITRSCGIIYPFADFCIITDRPDIIARDERGRLHSHDGPALRYRDGYALYASHGVRLEPWIIESPEQVTVAKIDAEQNAERRRVMIERYCAGHEVSGAGAFIRDAGGKRLDHDEQFGTLWRREVSGDEPIVMIEVINRSPEPDGHFRHYFLRVPPQMRTSHEAVAWTFGKTPETYRPMVET